jgi:hypothetical protein
MYQSVVSFELLESCVEDPSSTYNKHSLRMPSKLGLLRVAKCYRVEYRVDFAWMSMV